MVYLELDGAKFWRCDANNTTTVTTSYGKVGMDGRTMTKKFKTKKEANEFVEAQVESKKGAGYEEADDPKAKKKRKTPPTAPSQKAKPAKAGLAGHQPPPPVTNGSNGDNDGDDEEVPVDTGVVGVDSDLAANGKVHENYYARLALVDKSTNSDKYYILQLLVDLRVKKPRGRAARNASSKPSFFLYQRWGRTGTGGQCKLTNHAFDEDAAKADFEKVFKSKVGIDWSKATKGDAPKKGKYEYLQAKAIDTENVTSNWYYYLQNDPLSKPDGWYPYDKENRDEVEQLYAEYTASNNAARLATRFVHAESSGFTYEVDLVTMTQKNTSSGTCRPIQRSEDGTTPTGKPSKNDNSKKPAATTTKTSTPQAAAAAAPPVKKATKAATKSTPSSVRSSASVKPTVAGSVDGAVSGNLSGGSVYGEYDCMLNQTNLGANNNKFYKIQLIEVPSGIYLFTRWGRVGENGATQENGPFDSDKAIKEFCKKYKSKTANNWDDRDNFVTKKGKYTLVEMEADEDAANEMANNAATASGDAGAGVASKPKKVAPCSLDGTTKQLVDLIFDVDMFKSAMVALNIDPNKLPLGALSKAQIQKGFNVLVRLQDEIDNGAAHNVLSDTTSEFYTIIPHAFGRSRGPVLTTSKMVQEKFEMLNTLTDIESAQAMQKQIQKDQQQKKDDEDETVEHPSDLNYKQLSADLEALAKSDKEYKIIESFWKDTSTTHSRMKLRNVWKVNRHKENERFAEHDDLDNRKLLWHGTNVAVVAAILKSGLRIMPHSGGRVGRGIYLADQHQKSEWYVCPAKGTTIMFLVEAALGKMKRIQRDDSSITQAPAGFQSVLAEGSTAPTKEVELEIDGKKVMVPQGKPTSIAQAATSSFHHNEFLIYKESQHRIRYILAFDT